MVVDPSTAVVTGPSATLNDADATDTASVTVTGAAGTSVDVTLSTHPTGSDVTTDCTDTLFTVEFATLADLSEGEGAIRHVDVDCGTERAFDSGDQDGLTGDGDYDSNELDCNGLLSNGNVSDGLNAVTGFAQDDPDDAVGSEHTVCIIGTSLTSDDNADISWSITPAAPHQDPADPNTNKTAVDVNGDDATEPCVSWRVGDVGVEQDITAIYTPTGETIYSNGIKALPGAENAGLCPSDISDDNDVWAPCQPLIKQWNSILSTKIVQDTGNRDGNDCSEDTVDDASCANANLDGETVTESGVTNVDGFVVADSNSYLDYVLGAHDDYYPGTGAPAPVDGAQQTYTATGDCGSVIVEDPSDSSNEFLLDPTGPDPVDPTDPADGDNSVTLPTNSDKGVEFTISPTDYNTGDYNCVDGESTGVSIDTIESANFDSNDPFHPSDEDITVNWVAGPGPEKQPLLAWVGQRIVLEHDWSDPATGDCPWYPNAEDPFFVRYLIQSPSPGALSNVPDLAPAEVTGPDYIIVPVEQEDNCISHVIYESQNQGRVDVTAHVVAEPQLTNGDFVNADQLIGASDWSVISPEYDFWYYYMKLESTDLTIVPGTRSDHNAGSFTSSGADVEEITSNVSADVLLRVVVKGWVLADNCPVKEASADTNGLLLPANRCTFPDDWAQVVGDDEQFDLVGEDSTLCPGSNIAGPFSTLSGLPPTCYDVDSEAPHVGGGFRYSVFSDGVVDAKDAPMPPALVTLNLTGSGFLHGADKGDIYSADNQYFDTHIPAEPWILVAGSGYQWHTWNGVGDRSGLYHFWTSLAGTGDPITSCPGDSVGDSPESCAGGVPTGGYDMIQIYTDNHGEAMAWVNGDANLTFDECDDNLASHKIVQLSGHYCEDEDVVGTTTVTADADYPDKKPHRDVADRDPATGELIPVTITWTWGGTKDISVVAGEGPQFNYVVFKVTDRDGGCSENNSLHPVLGEEVQFVIDSPTGVIFHDANGNASALGNTPDNSKSATVETFDSGSYAAIDDTSADPADRISFDPTDDICEAWIHVSESQLANVNVVVTAFDPEGTVTFDTKDINPTPTPTPAPTAPPATQEATFGDVDCSGDVSVIDARKIILDVVGSTPTAPAGCPTQGDMLLTQQDGTALTLPWGDVDCDQQVRVIDARKAILYVVGADFTQTPPCFGIGSTVNIPQQ
jgi:hypothetical protein